MSTQPEPTDIIAEGRAAHRAGQPAGVNPYRGGNFYLWRRGWVQERASPTPEVPVIDPVEEPVEPNKRHVALVQQFERAVAEHEWIGTIPVLCEDADEQRRADAERRRLTSNLTKTRNNLLRELGREAPFRLGGGE